MAYVISDKKDPFKKFNQLYKISQVGCWEWQGTVNPENGYGQQRFNKKKWLVHRYSYLLHKGEIDNNLCVLHKCDNRKCVNPEHLFLGTRRENNIDCSKKGRKPRGENHSCAKLTNLEVEEIRHLQKNGFTHREIAEKFGVSRSTISMIINRINWAHA